MAYKKYKLSLLIRIVLLFLLLAVLAFVLVILKTNISFLVLIVTPLLALIGIAVNNLFKFTTRRFSEIDSFLESVLYRDFSVLFNENSGPKDVRELHKKFNKVHHTLKNINKEKQKQHLYLQKILELIGTGIMAYNSDTGNILWINDAFKKILNVPSLKNIHFIEKRKPKLYADLFKTNHVDGNTINIETAASKIDVLVSSAQFNMEDGVFQLLVLQNIDDTLNQNENEAWQKLLRVMTHEIMNSIAPISSLAETLQNNIRQSLEDPSTNKLDVHDLDIGIDSIKKRSEGLMKFAKTYRGLNKINHLQVEKVSIEQLFHSLENLLGPSLQSKSIKLNFTLDGTEPYIEIDRHLIEQVLINLVLNSVEASEKRRDAEVTVSYEKRIDGHPTIKVTDNGKGIDDEITDKVFVPFFTTKKKGSGIGLSLCKQIMLLHKGKIKIVSKTNRGTVVSLLFPK